MMLSRWLSEVMLSASAGLPLHKVQMKTMETPAGTAVARTMPAKLSGSRKGLAIQARNGVRRVSATIK